MNWLSSHDDHLIFRKDAFQLHFYFCQRVLLLTRFEKRINSHVIQIQKILLFPFYRDLSKFVTYTYIDIFLNPPPFLSNLRIEPELGRFPMSEPSRRNSSFTCPLEQTKGGPLATGIHSSLSPSTDLISGGSHEITVWHIILAERTSGLARVDGQYVLYMSEPALDVRRHISQPNLGRPRRTLATVFKVCKGHGGLVESEGRCRWASCSGCIDHWGCSASLGWPICSPSPS